MKLTIIENDRNRTIEFYKPALLSELLHMNEAHIDMPCGGRGSCGKCRVIFHGEAMPASAEELRSLGSDAEKGIRLACMTVVTGDGCIEIIPKDGLNIQTIGTLAGAETDGNIGYGTAFDIGTTTVAAYLCDLSSGEIISTASCKNTQSVYGADVISRIGKALNGELDGLCRTVRTLINELLHKLCADAGIANADIKDIVITANTTMEYLFCGLMPTSLSAAPFKADELFGRSFNSRELGLECGCDVYITRAISAFVGGDITSGIVSSELTSYTSPVVFTDIGTNGEVALFADGRLLCCSTAAGPAFEGAGIYMGMNASSGAISHVDADGENIVFKTIGGVKAAGLCGSGVIDAVSTFLKLGYIDETGYIDDECALACEADDCTALKIPCTDVVLTQKDVRAVQLAKSAICSGILTLIHEAGLEPEQIGKLIIAGGFGTVLDINSAENIGLIPEGFACKAECVGNAAGMGAVKILLSRKARIQSEDTARMAENIDLNLSSYFNELYIDNMYFGEI